MKNLRKKLLPLKKKEEAIERGNEESGEEKGAAEKGEDEAEVKRRWDSTDEGAYTYGDFETEYGDAAPYEWAASAVYVEGESFEDATAKLADTTSERHATTLDGPDEEDCNQDKRKHDKVAGQELDEGVQSKRKCLGVEAAQGVLPCEKKAEEELKENDEMQVRRLTDEHCKLAALEQQGEVAEELRQKQIHEVVEAKEPLHEGNDHVADVEAEKAPGEGSEAKSVGELRPEPIAGEEIQEEVAGVEAEKSPEKRKLDDVDETSCTKRICAGEPSLRADALHEKEAVSDAAYNNEGDA